MLPRDKKPFPVLDLAFLRLSDVHKEWMSEIHDCKKEAPLLNELKFLPDGTPPAACASLQEGHRCFHCRSP